MAANSGACYYGNSIFTLLPRWGNFLNALRDYAEKNILAV
jgi:hypothetical protein